MTTEANTKASTTILPADATETDQDTGIGEDEQKQEAAGEVEGEGEGAQTDVSVGELVPFQAPSSNSLSAWRCVTIHQNQVFPGIGAELLTGHGRNYVLTIGHSEEDRENRGGFSRTYFPSLKAPPLTAVYSRGEDSPERAYFTVATLMWVKGRGGRKVPRLVNPLQLRRRPEESLLVCVTTFSDADETLLTGWVNVVRGSPKLLATARHPSKLRRQTEQLWTMKPGAAIRVTDDMGGASVWAVGLDWSIVLESGPDLDQSFVAEAMQRGITLMSSGMESLEKTNLTEETLRKFRGQVQAGARMAADAARLLEAAKPGAYIPVVQWLKATLDRNLLFPGTIAYVTKRVPQKYKDAAFRKALGEVERNTYTR